MISTINDMNRFRIVLESAESYLAKIQPQLNNANPQEKLMAYQQAKDNLYRSIVVLVPMIAEYVNGADLETDTYAQGLWLAMCNHCKDPDFVKLLLDFLHYSNNPDYNRATGALLSKVASKLLKDKKAEAAKKAATTTTTKKDKDGKETTVAVKQEIDTSDIAHIYTAVKLMLGDVMTIVRERCGNLTEPEALGIAACLGMNSKDTIDQILTMNLPVTANLFDIVAYRDPTRLLTAALLMEPPKIAKLTPNQQTFLDSLKRWVYDKLNIISEQQAYQFLLSVYGPNPTQKDIGKYFINVRDCGNQYSNLLAVAKYLIK